MKYYIEITVGDGIDLFKFCHVIHKTVTLKAELKCMAIVIDEKKTLVGISADEPLAFYFAGVAAGACIEAFNQARFKS